MISTTTGQTEPTIDPADDAFSSNTGTTSKRAAKTYDYTCYQCGIDYYFELANLDTKAYMTGQGKGIKPNDYILLQLESTPQRYQVEMIDYYSHPSDMWIALLQAIN